MENNKAMGRPPKDKKGQTLFIPADILDEVKALIDRSNTTRKQKAIELARQRLIDAEMKLKRVIGDMPTATEAEVISNLNRMAEEWEAEPETLPSELDGLTTVSDDSILKDAPIYLVPVPETPITGFKQVEWVEPAPKPTSTDYDGTTPLQTELERLYKKSLSSNATARLVNDAAEALRIDRGVDSQGRASRIVDAPTRLRIYQWHVAKVGGL